MTAPTIHEQNLILGPLADLAVAPYVTAGGAPSTGDWIECGAVRKPTLKYKVASGEVAADNANDPIRFFAGKRDCMLEFEFLEENDELLAIIMGLDPDTSAITVDQVAGTTDGTQTLLVGDLSPNKRWQVRLVVDDQEIVNPDNADIYTKVTYTFWLCKAEPDLSADHSYSAGTPSYKAAFKVSRDSSVTTVDKLFKRQKWMDKGTAP